MNAAIDDIGSSVEIEAVSKWYGGKQVLRDISLRVPLGSFTSLLGPSGSGKTTTLGTVAGVVRADSGRVLIGDRDVTRVKMEHRDIGFVFQNYALFPHMTIEKNVAFPLRMRGIDREKIPQLVGEALERVRLAGYGKRYPSQLSGGQSQRAALARAIVFRPRALLLDEPLGALDATLRNYLQREIVEIAREINATVLYVTHDQQEALSMSDQVVLFREGEIDQIGTPQDLYRLPATRFAAGFIGAGCILDGTVRLELGHAYLVRPTGERLPITGGCPEGADASVLVRPEMVTAVATTEETPLGALPFGGGVVKDVIFKGEFIQNVAEMRSGELVEWRTTDLTQPWTRGTEVNLLLVNGALLAPIVERPVANETSPPMSADTRVASFAHSMITNH